MEGATVPKTSTAAAGAPSRLRLERVDRRCRPGFSSVGSGAVEDPGTGASLEVAVRAVEEAGVAGSRGGEMNSRASFTGLACTVSTGVERGAGADTGAGARIGSGSGEWAMAVCGIVGMGEGGGGGG